MQWERWEIRPWHDPHGHIGGIVIFSEDITANKEAERALAANRVTVAVLPVTQLVAPGGVLNRSMEVWGRVNALLDGLPGARQRLADSQRAYAAGDTAQARSLALSAYLDGVEPVEPTLATRDAALMRDIETAMARFRTQIGQGTAEVLADYGEGLLLLRPPLLPRRAGLRLLRQPWGSLDAPGEVRVQLEADGPVVWLDGLDIPEPYTGTQIPIFRTAYGDIYCFKPGLGQTLTVAPAVSMILLSSPIPILTTEWLDREMEAFLELPRRMFTQTSTYMPGTDEPFQENMFERIVGRLGRTTHNTIYSFDPPRQLRGDMRAENAILAEATTELTRLRTLKTPKIDPP